MTETRGRMRAAVRWAVAVTWGGLAALAGDTRADRIVLRGGGQVRGKVTPDPNRPDRVSVLTERGKTPLSFQKVQVIEVVAEPGPLDEYLKQRDATPATAEAQVNLGRWCEGHKLPDLARLHYETALGLDPTFGPAHRKVGHVLYSGRWLTADALREAQGLVRHKGKWITRDQKAGIDRAAAAAAEQSTWVKRIRLLRDAVVNSPDDRRREAEGQLLEIRDPVAVGPLVRVLGGDAGRLRTLLAHVLGEIPGPEATAALVARLLDEWEADVRYATMDVLLRRDASDVTRLLVRALRSNRLEAVNRAAWGLGSLHALTAVPSLVGSLISVRTETVMAPSAVGLGEGLGISASFGSAAPGGSAAGGPVAYGGGGTGAAAYGATASPLPGYGPSPAGVGLSAGGGVSATRGPFPRSVRVPFHNTEVLAALVKLTGQDFGWDVDAWKHWVRTSFDSEPTPSRRVPQP